MAFDITKLLQISTTAGAFNGIPGIFAYEAVSDNLDAVLTNGYFPSASLTGWVAPGDFLEIKATDGDAFKVFDSSFNLFDPLKITLPGLNVFTITAASGTLASGSLYIFNNSSAGTYTLPTAIGNSGKQVKLKKVSGLLAGITINTVSGQTIDGASSLSIGSLNPIVTLMSDGANWFSV